MVSAAMMSAARASRSAPASASASTAADACVPLMSARPSLGAEHDRRQPRRGQRVRPVLGAGAVPRLSLADQDERQMRQGRQVAARADRAAAGHERVHAAVDQRQSASSVDGRMPE